MRNYLIFGDNDSRDCGVYISGSGVFNAPSRDVTAKSIPGRSGDLLLEMGRYNNLDVEYPAFCYNNFRQNFAKWRNILLSLKGYHKLRDTYNPEEYRLAAFTGPVDVDMTQSLAAGEFTMTFNCKPQRFLTSGELTQTFTKSGTIWNPTMTDALPLLRVYGTGTIGIGGDTVQITAANVYTDLDCDIMEAYKGTQSCNGNIILSGTRFPVLEPGGNNISLGTGITRIDITPRWYIL